MRLLEAIISLFVILDPIGNIPAFLSVTSSIPKESRQRAFTTAVLVAGVILLLFAFTGDIILHKVFQIQIADIQIAGGALLIIMAIDDLVFGSRRRPKTAEESLSAEEVGCVPLGCPLLAGPGAIVTTMMIWKNSSHGPLSALLAIILVLGFFRIVMLYVEKINQLAGRLIITAVSKVMLVFLAAIGVRMLMMGIGFYFPAVK